MNELEALRELCNQVHRLRSTATVDDDFPVVVEEFKLAHDRATDRLNTQQQHDLIAHLHRQRIFSLKTFGPGMRTKGLLDHIRKELTEIEQAPGDLYEWVDLVLLALDGAWRAGYSDEAIATAIDAKMTRNEARTWPDWRTADPDKAIEHVRDQ